MNYKLNDIIEFIIGVINDFAKHMGLSEHQAYNYLRSHDAIPFIEKHYGVMHTLDDKEIIESINNFCNRSK